LKQAKWPLQSAESSHARPSKFKFKKSASNGQYYQQTWMGSTALYEHIMAFFSRAEKPSEDINSRLFFDE
jgi:hypothetical protein